MKRIATLILIGIIVSAPGAGAEPFYEHTFGITPEVYQTNYEEPDLTVEIEGVKVGGTLYYEYHQPGDEAHWMMRMEGHWSYGELSYESVPSGAMDGIPDYTVETRFIVGYDFLSPEGYVYTLFSGFGYRYLNNDSSGISTTLGALGYERESNYFYLPLGLFTAMDLKKGWSMELTAEYDWLLAGEQVSHLGDASALLGTSHNKQSKGFGYRGDLKLIRKSERSDFYFGPFVRIWDIEKSEDSLLLNAGGVLITGYEPENNTAEYGGEMGVRF